MKFNHILSGLALTAAVLAAGCQKSLEYSDVVYFTGTENSNITNMYVCLLYTSPSPRDCS